MLDQRHYAARTVALRLSTVKAFLTYCSIEDITLVTLSLAASWRLSLASRGMRDVLAAPPRLTGTGGRRNAADPFVIGLARSVGARPRPHSAGGTQGGSGAGFRRAERGEPAAGRKLNWFRQLGHLGC